MLLIAVCTGNIQYTAVHGTEISLPTSIFYCDSSYLKGVLYISVMAPVGLLLRNIKFIFDPAPGAAMQSTSQITSILKLT